MLNDKTVSVKMRRIDLANLMTACTMIKYRWIAEAYQATKKEDRDCLEASAEKWTYLHDMLERQLNAFDEKHADEI